MNATTSTPHEYTEEGRAFLQLRVARFGLYGAYLGYFFVVVRVVEAAFMGHLHQLIEPSLLFHVLGSSSLLGVWFACRSGSRSVNFLRKTETACIVVACACYAAMGLYIPVYSMPHFVVILALGFGLMARAIYVPSSGLRTLLITSLSGIPMIVTTYLMYHDMDIEPWLDIDPNLGEVGASGLALSTMTFAAAWWVCVVLICFGGSRVIYGLRKEVRDVRKLGQYTLMEKLGEGGMGIVYKASHAMLRRPTAIKLLPVEKSGEQHLLRFEKEVQHTAMLTHPNTVTIFDYGRTPEGVFYYAMEFLEGATLADLVEVDGPQPAARVIHVLDQVAGALAEAHGVGLVHRDIKPANVMLVEQGGKPDVAKVLDFGLVKELERADDAVLTQAGAVTGTPQYLSPEAIQRPDVIDPRSDIYALGAVGYFLVTGEQVFSGDTVIELCMAHLQTPPESPSERLGAPVPADLEALILRCLAKDPGDRPESARAVQRALRDCGEGGRWGEEEARGWWRRLRPTLAALRERQALTGMGLTMEVALHDRTGHV